MTDKVLTVRNKTGEPRRVGTLGEEGYPVNRVLDDDDTLDLPAHLARRLAEQPGWELDDTSSKASSKTEKPASSKSGE